MRQKIVTALIAVATMIFIGTALSINAENGVSTQRIMTIEYSKPVVYQGAIITKQLNDEVTYAKKCEKCGYYEDGFKFSEADVGVIKSAFTCPKCKKKQEVYIVVKGFVQDVFVSHEEYLGYEDGDEIPADLDQSGASVDEDDSLYSDDNAQEVTHW